MGQSDAVDLLDGTAIVRMEMDQYMSLIDAFQKIEHLMIVDVV
jgi:hypothetical protein